jgi:hypothetical protein
MLHWEKQMITIKATTTEYLLSIPASQKERAKKIQGRIWDGDRICWVYPKSKRSLDELIAEFGDDISKDSIDLLTGNKVHPSTTSTPHIENSSLKKELEEIKQSVMQISLSTNSNNSSQISLMNQRILGLITELATVNARLESREKELSDTKGYLQTAQIQLSRYRKLLEEKEITVNGFDEILIDRAKEATSNDSKFIGIIGKSRLESSLLTDITNKMAVELRKLTNNNDRESSLYDLIGQASENELLPPEAIDMAHIIRKERNKVVHGEVYGKTHEARIILALFAAALLWPYFPE